MKTMNQDISRANDIYKRICANGLPAIDEFIQTRQSEELFLDFKRSSDSGNNSRLSDNDRKNLGKAISGFGNSAGGVIVWGVECAPSQDGADVASSKVPIKDPTRYVSWLNAVTSGCTYPPHPGVQHTFILDGTGLNGFTATLIPQSNHAPHQALPDQKYYIRAGSCFVSAPHQLLASLFGKRPMPYIYGMFDVAQIIVKDKTVLCCHVGIQLRNDGPGIARDLYATAYVHSSPTPNSIRFQLGNVHQWDSIVSWGRHVATISKKDIRLPPKSQICPLLIDVDFSPPFTSALNIHVEIGAGASEPYLIDLIASSADMQAAYTNYFTYLNNANLGTDHRCFVSKLMGLPNNEHKE
jgi:hypothetical protein